MTVDRGVRLIGNRYRLHEPLGRGGMGVVWAATDEVLGRDVAVKEVIPPPGLTAEQAESTRSRSMREARAAARITSRSAVNVYDVVEEDGRPWIVMELLQARPLSEIINADGPLPPAQVAEIAAQLLDALVAAHASGVLHRDVKPSNVMLAADGRAVLTDFGIAALDGDPSLTTTGMLIGSPAYIAPERAHGEPASAASDLWSLGCTMFAALEGRPPFDREGSMATLNAVISEDPLPAASAGPLSSVLEGLLRKDPRQRLTAEDTDRLLKASMSAPPAAPRQETRPAGPPLTGGTTGVLPVVPGVPPAAPAANLPPPPVRRVAPARAPGSAPPALARPRRGRGALVALVVAALVVVAIVAAGILATRGDDQDQTAVPPADSEGSDDGTDPATDAGTEPTEDAVDPTEGAVDPTEDAVDPTEDAVDPTEDTGVPEGFERYVDETGFSIAVPADWEVTTDGPRTDFTEPGTGRFLRVDQTDDPQPDPVADWENQAATAPDRLSGYEQIRIEPVEYREYDAADWEFTWVPDGGDPLHVLNRNLITAPDQAYALYWSTPDDQWEDSLPLFETFTETFQPDP